MVNLNKKVDVIAYHTQEGLIHPLKFRVEEDGNSNVYKLNVNYFSAEKVSKDNMVYRFNCSYINIDSDKRITCELNYQLNSQIWTLSRIF